MKKFGNFILTCGTIMGLACIIQKFYKNKYELRLQQTQNDRDKFWNMFQVMDDWVNKKIINRNIYDYLASHNYNEIAIYGLSYMGQTIVNELEESNITIKYGIDVNYDMYWNEFPVVSPENVTNDVDVIIVTAISAYESIKSMLSCKVSCPIVSLDEIISIM